MVPAEAFPVVAGEGFTVPVAWRSDPIAPQWLLAELESRGWKLQKSELGESEVRFVDGSGAGSFPDPPIQLGGLEKVGSLPAIGFARMPSDFLTFERGRLSLQVVVTETADDWARQWATYLLEIGERQTVPFGAAAVAECGVLLHDGETLINASWWVDGVTVGPGRLGGYAASPAGDLLSLPAGT